MKVCFPRQMVCFPRFWRWAKGNVRWHPRAAALPAVHGFSNAHSEKKRTRFHSLHIFSTFLSKSVPAIDCIPIHTMVCCCSPSRTSGAAGCSQIGAKINFPATSAGQKKVRTLVSVPASEPEIPASRQRGKVLCLSQKNPSVIRCHPNPNALESSPPAATARA